MWKKTKFKRGVISLLLIIGLVITNLHPFSSMASNEPKEEYKGKFIQILTPVYGEKSARIAENLLTIVEEKNYSKVENLLTKTFGKSEETKSDETKAKDEKQTEETKKETAPDKTLNKPEEGKSETPLPADGQGSEGDKEEAKVNDGKNDAADETGDGKNVEAGETDKAVEGQTGNSVSGTAAVENLSRPEPQRAQAEPTQAGAATEEKKVADAFFDELMKLVDLNANVETVKATLNELNKDNSITAEKIDELVKKFEADKKAAEEAAKNKGEQKNGETLEWNSEYMLKKTVKQDGNETPDESLDLNKDFSLTMSVKLPVSPKDSKGKERPHLVKGSSISIPLATGVKLAKDYKATLPATLELENGDKIPIKKAFNAETKIEDKNKVYMVMTLLVDNEEFNNGEVNAMSEIVMNFSIDKENINEEDGKKTITIVEKKVEIKGDIKSQFEMKKTGEVDFNNGNIDWTVEIEHKGEDGKERSLEGYKFEDPIEKVGTYVEGTLKVEDASGKEIQVQDLKTDENSVTEEGKALTFIFPAKAPSKVKVKFSTSLKVNNEYGAVKTGFTKDNIAYLYAKDEAGSYKKEVCCNKGTVAWSGRWGVKYQNTSTNKNYVIKNLITDLNKKGSRITWEDFAEGDTMSPSYIKDNKYQLQWNIVFDATDKKLKNVTVRDVFPIKGRHTNDAKLEFVSAKMRKWDRASNKWEDKDISNELKNGSFFIGDLDTVVKITVWSEMDVTALTGIDRFTNHAYFTWQDISIELAHSVDLGNKIFNKSFTGDYGYADANPEWKIKVSKDYVDNNADNGGVYIYDTVIYGGDTYWSLLNSPDKVYADARKQDFTIEGNLESGIDLDKLVFNAGDRKMVYDSGFDGGLKPKVYPLKYKGKEVGHLLEFKLTKGCTPVVSESNNAKYYQFSFKTHVVDADTVTGGPKRENDSDDKFNQLCNLAYLVKGKDAGSNKPAEKIAFSDSWPSYNHRMLQKDALKKEAAENLIEGDYAVSHANNIISGRDGAYSKKYKSIVYRLSVNAANVKSFIGNKKYMEALIKDSIDKNFELTKFNEAYDYIVYEGTANVKTLPTKDAYVNAEGINFSKDDVNNLFKVTEPQKVGEKLESEFRFKKLEKPYVILYRVQQKDYSIRDNKVSTVHNTATFTAWNEKSDINKIKRYSLKSSKEVNYDSRFLSKTYEEKDGIVRWKIAYSPFMMDDKTKNAIANQNVKSVKLYDELDKGLTVFAEDGKPYLGGKAYSLYKVDKDGKMVDNGDYTDKLQELLAYQKKGEKDTLTLNIPLDERNNNFVFEYSTILDDTASGNINNTVKILVDEKESSQAETKVYDVAVGVKINIFKTGNNMDLTVHKVDESGLSLANVGFTLTRPGNKKETLFTGKDGNVVFKKLTATNPGEEYLLEETTGKEGYVKDNNTYSFGVKLFNNKFLVIKDFKVKGENKNKQLITLEDNNVSLKAVNESGKKVKLIKVNKKGEHLSGAVFKLSLKSVEVGKEDKLISNNLVTDDKGEVTLEKLKNGTYILEEVKAPAGYNPTGDKFEFTVNNSSTSSINIIGDNNDIISLTEEGDIKVVNEKVYDLELIKANADDKANIEKDGATKKNIAHKLSGARFSLTDYAKKTLVEEQTTDSNGTLKFTKLKKGKYTLKEVTAPNGYNSLLDDDTEITVEVDPDAEKGEEVKLTTTDNENVKWFDNAIVVFNELKKNSIQLELIKADVADAEAKELVDIKTKLKNATFKLVYDDDNTVSMSAITGNEGKLNFAVDKAGTYTLTEVTPPSSYAILARPYKIRVNPGAKSGKRVEVIDPKKNEIKQFGDTVVVFNEKRYDLKLVKADLDANKSVVDKVKNNEEVTLKDVTSRLDDVEFTLTSGSSVVSKQKTSKPDGIIVFERLETGTYTLTETAPKAGYNSLGKSYSVVVTTAAVNKSLNKGEKDEFAIKDMDENVAVIENSLVVFNKKTPGVNPGPNPDPNPTPDPDPTPGGGGGIPNVVPPTPDPDPTPTQPTPPTPTNDVPTYPEDSLPNPNDPDSPDEFVSVDEDGTPQGHYVKRTKPDGTKEYVEVNDDGTPQGVKPAKKALPKTGGSDNFVYYLSGAILLFAAGVLVIRRKKRVK